jgi:hypothetical protein
MLILQGVRQFMRENDSILCVVERRILKHEKFVLMLIIKRRDLFAEQVDVFLPQRKPRFEQTKSCQRRSDVGEFLLGENLGNLTEMVSLICFRSRI